MEYIKNMAPLATNTDAFIAIAEPHRRMIIEYLSRGERAAGEIVSFLGLAQSMVSKHLKVLREVGIVQVQSIGRTRIYRLEPKALEPVHAWVAVYEEMWTQQFDRLDLYLKEQDGSDRDEGARNA